MSFSTNLKTLGEVRDGLLVVVTIIYLCGYAAWSSYAWRERLGPISALDAQYFAAGVPISLLLLVTAGAIIGLHRVAKVRWQPFMEKQTTERRDLIRVAIIGGILLLVALVILLMIIESFWTRMIAGLIILIGYTALHLYGYVRPEPDFFTRFAPAVVIILFGFIGVVYFAGEIYQKIPDALSGGRPRRVTLDIRADALSSSTIDKLVNQSFGPVPSSGIVQTRELSLMTTQGDYYLVIVPANNPHDANDRIQIQRTAVQAITWK